MSLTLDLANHITALACQPGTFGDTMNIPIGFSPNRVIAHYHNISLTLIAEIRSGRSGRFAPSEFALVAL